MTDYQVPILAKDGYHQPLHNLKRSQWWIFVILNIFFLIVGQAAAVLLGRYYYANGGNNIWMATIVQTAAFPILFIPYCFLRSPEDSVSSSRSLSTHLLIIIYVVFGALMAGDNMLYSVGLLYLSASTYSLICATQISFHRSFFLLHQSSKVNCSDIDFSGSSFALCCIACCQ